MILLLLACGTELPPDDSGPAVAAAPSAVLPTFAVLVVGEAATFDATGSVGERFTWDFGDGEAAEGLVVEHTFTTPGRRTIRLVAENADGRSDTEAALVVAVNPPLEEAPTQSGKLVYAEGRLYAALSDADLVVVVEAAKGTVEARWDTCHRPVSLSAAEGTLYVACEDDTVERWALATGARQDATTLRWGCHPSAVVAEGAGAWVACAGAGEVWALAADGPPEPAGSLPDGGALAAGAGGLWGSRFRSPVEGGELRRLDGDGATWSLPPDPGPDSDTDARGLPNLLGALALRPDGQALVVGGTKANMDRGLWRDGEALTHETTSRAALRAVDPTTGEALGRAHFDNRDRVGALCFSPLGDTLYVAQLGSDIVDELDPWTLTRVGGIQGVGLGLDGMVSDGERLFVLASLDRELVAYTLTPGNEEEERWRAGLVDDEPLDPELLLGERVFHDASDPRMVTDAYISCAVCHPDGGHDGRTWDFTDRGEGLRDTQALWALPPDGPFHWSANFDELQDFENAIRAFQEGQGFLSDEDFARTEDPLGEPKAGLSPELDAMAAWILSRAAEPPRSPWREEDGSWTAEAELGRERFAALGCDECHADPRGTDAGWNEDGSPVLHDVGTILESSGGRAGGALTGLRTPPLVGLFATAPYLHDGRAPTLEDALTAHGIEPEPELVRYLLEIEGER